jgi:hypothetical protein
MEKDNELLIQIEQLKNLNLIEINNFKNSQIKIQIELDNFNDFMKIENLKQKEVFLKKYLFESNVIEKNHRKYIFKCKDILMPIENELMCFSLYSIYNDIVYTFTSKTNVVVERNLEKFYKFVFNEEKNKTKQNKENYIDNFYKQTNFIESIAPDIVNSVDFELCTNKKLRQHFLTKYLIDNKFDTSNLDIELISDILYTKVKKNKKQREFAISK